LLSPSRGKARGGPRGKWRRSSALPDALQVPGGLGNGAQAPGGAGLSSRHLHELATEGVRARRIGVMVGHPGGPHGSSWWLTSCAAKADLVLTCRSSACMASARRIMLLVRPSSRAQARRARHTNQVQRRSGVVLADRTGRRVAAARRCIAQASSAGHAGGGRRPGSAKRVFFDEMTRGDGPGAPPLGGESNPVNPSAGSATEGVRGKGTTFAPG